MMNTKFNIKKELVHRIKSLKFKTKMELHEIIKDCYDQMIYMVQIRKFQFGEGLLVKVLKV